MPMTISLSVTPSLSWGSAGTTAPSPRDGPERAREVVMVVEDADPAPPLAAAVERGSGAPAAAVVDPPPAGAALDGAEPVRPGVVADAVVVSAPSAPEENSSSDVPDVATVVDTPGASGAAPSSAPPTPAFCPQAAETSTATAAARARHRIRPERMDDEGTDRAVRIHPEGGRNASTTGRSWA
jgi:hypothetical protein